MASIRRALFPVPQQGTLVAGEAERSVPSPLSKSSSCSSNHPSTNGGLISSLFGLSDSQALVFGVFSPRTCRSVDRSKHKGQVWRRALFHFFICFVVGSFIGLTSFVSVDFSYMNDISKQQAFSVEVVSTVGSFQTHESLEGNVTSMVDNTGVENNVTLEAHELVQRLEMVEGNLGNALINQSLLQDINPESRKLLIVITPTYTRPLQAYYLNRLAYTLKLVQPPLLWIVVDMTSQSEETADTLRKSSVMYRHLVCKKNLTDMKDRNIHQRNVALSHIENHRLDGIVFFANEGNIYSIDLFEQMRHIRRFGTWTVAKQTLDNSRVILEGPVCNGTQVIGWHLNGQSRRFRRFHAEMPGFAFNSTILWDPKRWHRPTLEQIRQLDTVKDDFQSSSIIDRVVEDESQMEGLPLDCSRIMVWELNIETSNSFHPQRWLMKNNLDIIAPLA
ncbi:IRREGULAR XYLEM 9-LIKE, IRREGULAR XYLEM 9 Homolog [Hibiscus trionum]|uniref:Glycosyltransferases n=1 Tax=Hibiscus trionum TaxID=183268 RepID=A0A9W7I3Z6_HIBTR|nr:IRREGULAR XYLEM 9-LIKE, IRREGULAR XYLEM 9 Homolog [Hibiscus trionum]